MINVISADALRTISDLNNSEFEKGFKWFEDILTSAAYKGWYEATVAVNPDWARRHMDRIYEELEALGFTEVKLYESSVYLSWKKDMSEKDEMTKVDNEVETAFRNFKYEETNKAVHGVLDALKETAISTPGEDGGFDIIISPGEVWGKIGEGVLRKSLERGGLYKVTEFNDQRIVVSWRLKNNE